MSARPVGTRAEVRVSFLPSFPYEKRQTHVGHPVAQECCYPHVLSHSNERVRKNLKNYVKYVPTSPSPPAYDITSRRITFRPTRTRHITSASFAALECHVTLNGHIFIDNYVCSYVQFYAQ